MYGDHGYFMGGMHALWWVFWLLLIVAVVGVVRWAARDRRRDRETPLEVLQRRLASGDIDPEAYEKAKALLERDASD